MENSLVAKVDQLEPLFNNQQYDNSLMIRTHIETILDDAGYKKSTVCKNIYQKIEQSKIDFFGFEYKSKNELYHVQFDDLDIANHFLETNKKIANYDQGILRLAFTIGGMGIGLLSTIALYEAFNMNSDPTLPSSMGAFFGGFFGVLASLKIEESGYKKLIEKLDDIPKELATGFDAVKSAAKEY